MAKKSAISGEYIITVEDSGTVRVCKIYDNVIGSLREIAEAQNFTIDPKWNTQETAAVSARSSATATWPKSVSTW